MSSFFSKIKLPESSQAKLVRLAKEYDEQQATEKLRAQAQAQEQMQRQGRAAKERRLHNQQEQDERDLMIWLAESESESRTLNFDWRSAPGTIWCQNFLRPSDFSPKYLMFTPPCLNN